MRVGGRIAVWAMAALIAAAPAASAPAHKAHLVVLGAVRHAPYSKAGDPAGALPGESELNIRAPWRQHIYHRTATIKGKEISA